MAIVHPKPMIPGPANEPKDSPPPKPKPKS